VHAHPAHLAVAAAALAGCSFTAGSGGTNFRCDSDISCPSGTRCGSDGYCQPDGDAGAADGGPTAICGTTAAMRESFDDAERFAWFWNNDSSMGASAAAEGGRLVLRLPIGEAAYAGRTALRWYRFHDGSGLTLRVVEPPGGTARLSLYLVFAGGMRVRLVAGEGLIRVQRDEGTGWSTIGEQTYQTTGASRWQVREAGGELLFEIAGEDSDWSELATLPELPAEPVEVSFFLNDDLARDAPVSAAVDDLNPDTDGVQCVASTLTDGFDDGKPGLEWATWSYGSCQFAEEDGQLRFRIMGDAYSDCGYRSRAGYDMTGDAIAVEVVPAEPDAGGLNFGIRIADGYAYLLRLRAGTLDQEAWALRPDGEELIGSTAYTPETVRYWRLEHDSATGELRYLYSADGVDWTLLAATQGTDLEDVRITAYGSEFAAGDGAVAFERLNLVGR